MGTVPKLGSIQIDEQCEWSSEWVKLIERELWKVLDALDTVKLAIAMTIREDAERHGLKRFAVALDHAGCDLQGLLLDVLCSETGDGEEGD